MSLSSSASSPGRFHAGARVSSAHWAWRIINARALARGELAKLQIAW